MVSALLLGFDGTSNVLAAKKYGIPAKGTHAHAFVSSFHNNEVQDCLLLDKTDNTIKPFAPVAMNKLKEVAKVLQFDVDQTNSGELNAFIAYANSFPTSFLALVDTYDALK